MVVIKFPDRDALKKGLGFLLGRSSGHVLRSGEVIVPESAVEALIENNFVFTVLGKATYEQQVACFEVMLSLQFNDWWRYQRDGEL